MQVAARCCMHRIHRAGGNCQLQPDHAQPLEHDSIVDVQSHQQLCPVAVPTASRLKNAKQSHNEDITGKHECRCQGTSMSLSIL